MAEDNGVFRARVKRIVGDLRAAGYGWEHWGVVERNPERPDLFHFHGLQRGSYVPQGVLQRICQRRGYGFPWIRAYERQGHRGPGYVLKGVRNDLTGSGYALKGQSELLDLNGGRFGQWTRGFFEGGYRAALDRAVRDHYGRSGRASPGVPA